MTPWHWVCECGKRGGVPSRAAASVALENCRMAHASGVALPGDALLREAWEARHRLDMGAEVDARRKAEDQMLDDGPRNGRVRREDNRDSYEWACKRCKAQAFGYKNTNDALVGLAAAHLETHWPSSPPPADDGGRAARREAAA